MKELTESEIVSKTTHFCATSEHCATEVLQFMQRWNVSTEIQQRVLTFLTTEKYIDETRYATSFMHDKLRFNKWGRIKIAQILRSKQIPEDVIRTALYELDESEYLSTLKEVIETKRKGIKGANEFERNGKLIRFALGRGFEMEYIRKCLLLEWDE